MNVHLKRFFVRLKCKRVIDSAITVSNTVRRDHKLVQWGLECRIQSHEQNSFRLISQVQNMLWFQISQRTRTLMCQTKARKGNVIQARGGTKNTQNERSSRKWTSISMIFRYSWNQPLSWCTPEAILQIRCARA